jgi:LytR cell envelope-related transcriptional attenuator
VDHPLAPPEALVRPWRLAAYVAATIATVELVILLGIGGGALLESISHKLEREAQQRALAPAAKPKAAGPARKAKATPDLPRRRVVVRVLNGNGRSGAAASAASQVRDRGYKIAFVGNAPRTDFATSLVMYKPGFVGEAQRFARDLHVRRVGPLDGVRPRELGRAHVVFILGA